MQHQPVSPHGGRTVTASDFFLPDERQPACGPFLQQPRFPGDTGSARPEEPRPIFAGLFRFGIGSDDCVGECRNAKNQKKREHAKHHHQSSF